MGNACYICIGNNSEEDGKLKSVNDAPIKKRNDSGTVISKRIQGIKISRLLKKVDELDSQEITLTEKKKLQELELRDFFNVMSSKIFIIDEYSISSDNIIKNNITRDNLIEIIRENILCKIPSSIKRIEYLSRCFYETYENRQKEKERTIEERVFLEKEKTFQYLKESLINQLILIFFNNKKTFINDLFNHIQSLTKNGYAETWVSYLFDFLTKNVEKSILVQIFELFFEKLHHNMNEYFEEKTKMNSEFTAKEILCHVHILKISTQFPVLRRIILDSKKINFEGIKYLTTTSNFFEMDDGYKQLESLSCLRNTFLGPFFRMSVRTGKLSNSFIMKEWIEKNKFDVDDGLKDVSYLEMKKYFLSYRKYLGEICLNFTRDPSDFTALFDWFENCFYHLSFHMNDLKKNIRANVLLNRNLININYHNLIKELTELKYFGYNLAITFISHVFFLQQKNKIRYSLIDPILGYLGEKENFISVSRLSGIEVLEYVEKKIEQQQQQENHDDENNTRKSFNYATRSYFLMMKMMNVSLVPEILELSNSNEDLYHFEKLYGLTNKKALFYDLICDRVDIMGGNMESFLSAVIRCQMFNLKTLKYFLLVENENDKIMNSEEEEDEENEGEEVEISFKEERIAEGDQIPISYGCIPEYFLSSFYKVLRHIHRLNPFVSSSLEGKLIIDKVLSDENIFELNMFVELTFFLLKKPQYYRHVESYEMIKTIVNFFPSHKLEYLSKYVPLGVTIPGFDSCEYQFSHRFVENEVVKNNLVHHLLHFFIHTKAAEEHVLNDLIAGEDGEAISIRVLDIRNEVSRIFHEIIKCRFVNPSYSKFYNGLKSSVCNSMETRVNFLSILLTETEKVSLKLLMVLEEKMRKKYNEQGLELLSAIFSPKPSTTNLPPLSCYEKKSHEFHVTMSKKDFVSIFYMQRQFLSRITIISELISFTSDQLDAIFCNQIAQFVNVSLMKLFYSEPVQMYPMYQKDWTSHVMRDEILFTLAEIIVNVCSESSCTEEFFYGLVRYPGFGRAIFSVYLRNSLESFSHRVGDEEEKGNIVNSNQNLMKKRGKIFSNKRRFVELLKEYDKFLKDFEEYEKCHDHGGDLKTEGGEEEKEEEERRKNGYQDEFCCGLTFVLMTDPVCWKGSSVVVERSAILRCLLLKEEDPFTREKLTQKMLKSLPELKKRIMEYRKNLEMLKKRKKEKKEDGEN